MSEYCNNFIFHDDTSDTFQSWQGLRGPYFTPYVDEHGNLSWTNNGGLPNPATVNIAGQGIMLKGSCATTGDLPADPENGDAWAVGASEPFECYAWLGGSWVDLGLMFPKGDPGEGVSSGGTTGQILKKSSNTDYDTEWADPDQADWDQADNTQPDYIKNKPSIPVIDDTLSTAGQAADAKAAGDGIKEAEQIVSYVENGAAASRNYTAGEYITWKGVAYYAKTNISSGASFVVDTNLTAVGNQGYTNHLKNTLNSEIATRQTYVRPNLLDNWYFVYGKAINNDYSSNETFPVNQRGQQSYSAEGYTIDRWTKERTTHTVEIQSDCIEYKRTSLNYNPSFLQKVILPAGTYTFSILYKTSKEQYRTVMDVGGGDYMPVSNSWALFSRTKTISTAGTHNFGLQDMGSSLGTAAVGDKITVMAMKLELGSGQTLAHNEGTDANPVWVLNEIPDYGEELAKCQRYFLNLSEYERNGGSLQACIGQVYCFDTGTAMIQIPTPVTMAKVPTTIVVNGAVVIIASTTKYKAISNATPTAITKNSNHIYLTVNCDLAKGDIGYFQSASGFTISADL